MDITGNSFRIIVSVIIVAIIIGLGYSSALGKKQDEQFLIDQSRYNYALQELQNENYNLALKELEKINSKKYKSAPLKYLQGISLLNNQNYGRAITEFQLLIDYNPYITEDAHFMLLFAKTLINGDQLNDAMIVLEKCKEISDPDTVPDYQKQVNELINYISERS